MIGELFDPKASFAIRETIKPHWTQAGAIVFITLRTVDSIPAEVLELWDRQRCDWLQRCGVLEPQCTAWKSAVERLTHHQRQVFNEEFNRIRDTQLDECLGACVMRDPTLAKIVADSLMHFDQIRYRMGDFVVMPNHVHLLAAFPDEKTMSKQCTSWMHYTAREINRRIGKSGHFWQSDPFDHLVRSPDQYDYLRTYIADNPKKARLEAGQYHYRRYPD